MIEIDGSRGEGGGQILRTALALSCLEGKPFRIGNIRRGREKPGLMPQHLAAVRAARRIADAEVAGDRPGSLEMTFSPRAVRGGDLVIDVGTAGSALLVFQTVAPALAAARSRSVLTIKGGTHVPFSPPYDHAAEIFLPCLKRIGVDLEVSIEACGFYPRGGGLIRAAVAPMGTIRPLRADVRGGIRAIGGRSGVGNLPLTIAERQQHAALAKVRQGLGAGRWTADVRIEAAPATGQGTWVFLACESEGGIAGFSALGRRGKRAEEVGEEAAGELIRYAASGMALDPHLADQLVPWLALCPEESSFTTSRISRHLLTNLWTVGLFREFRFAVDGEPEGPGRIRINPAAPARDGTGDGRAADAARAGGSAAPRGGEPRPRDP